MVEILRRTLIKRTRGGAPCLTRRVGEVVYVDLPSGEQVCIELKEIRKNQARLGVSAPQTCRIWRGELGQQP